MTPEEFNSIEVGSHLTWYLSNDNSNFIYIVNQKTTISDKAIKVNITNIYNNKEFHNYLIYKTDPIKIINNKTEFTIDKLKSNQRWRLENISNARGLVRIFTLDCKKSNSDKDTWSTKDDDSPIKSQNRISIISTIYWNTPDRWKMTLLCDDVTKEDHSVKFFKKAIEQTIQWANCTCPEDHQHNNRGCITGMCSCRSQQPYKMIPVEKKKHRFDKYARAININNDIKISGGACLDCGIVIENNKPCTPDPEWRILQEKQFAFYMEEADKVRKMNG